MEKYPNCVLDPRPELENLLPPEVNSNSNIFILQKEWGIYLLEEEIWKGQGMKQFLQAAHLILTHKAQGKAEWKIMFI